MYREFFRSALIYGLCHALSRVAAIMLLPVITRHLVPSEYGRLEMVRVLGAVVHVTFALEINQALAYFLGRSTSDPERIAYSSTALGFTTVAYGTFLAVLGLVSGPFGWWLFDTEGLSDLVVLAGAGIAAEGIFRLTLNQLRWGLRPGAFALCDLTYAVAMTSVTVVLLNRSRAGMSAVLWGQLAGFVAGGGLGLLLARDWIRPAFDRSKFREMLRLSVPLVGASVIGILGLHADRLVLRELGSLADVGVYGAACRFGAIAGILCTVFERALSPVILRNAAEPETPRRLAALLRGFLTIALGAFLGFSLFAPEIATVLTGPEYRSSAALAPLTVGATLLQGLTMFAPGWFIARRTGMYTTLTLVATLIQVALLVVLVPRLGSMGAAWASGAGGFATFSALMMLSQRSYPAPHPWMRIGASALVAIGIVTLSVGLSLEGPGWGWKGAAARGALGTLGAGVCALLLFRKSDFQGLRRVFVPDDAPPPAA